MVYTVFLTLVLNPMYIQMEDEIVHTTRTALIAVFAAQAVLLAFALKLRLSSVLKQQDVKLSGWQGELPRCLCVPVHDCVYCVCLGVPECAKQQDVHLPAGRVSAAVLFVYICA